MQIIRDVSDLSRSFGRWRDSGEKIAFVPTMGALHAGHLALIAAAKREADRVIASIFVNPLQFNDKQDLARYPRQESADSEALKQAGCDLLWLPTAAEIYPESFSTTITVAGVSERWEGEHRPGHFDGVATVVAKLLMAVRPDVAIFGEKDWQQLAVIRRMTSDLGIAVTLIGHPTVREHDGLALSSRNALLAPGDRERAASLYRVLSDAAAAIGQRADVAKVLGEAMGFLRDAGFQPIDYLAYVDGGSLEPLDQFQEGGRLIAAAYLGDVRLIDNLSVVSATPQD